jgi:prolyl oligopeptidase
MPRRFRNPVGQPRSRRPRLARRPRHRHAPALALALAPLLLSAGCHRSSGSAPPPPATQRDTTTFTLHGQRFADPYQWLADGSNPEVRRWIAAESAYAETVVGETPLRDSLRAQLRRLEDVPEAGSPQRSGRWEYFTLRRPGDAVAGIFRRPAPPADSLAPIDPAGSYQEVVDPLRVDSTGWTRVELRDVSPDGSLVLYDLRDGGADETALRIRDVAHGTDLAGAFPPALYDQAAFSADGRAITYVLRSRQTGSRLYWHRLGTDPARDSVVLDPHVGPDRFLGVRPLDGGRERLVTEGIGWLRDVAWIQHADGSRVSVTGGLPMHVQVREHDGKLWILTDWLAPRYRLVVADPAHPGPADWREVLPETGDVLTGYAFIGDSIYATYLHDVSARIRIFASDGTPRGEVPLPPFSSAAIRPAPGGRAFLTVQSFTTPAVTYVLDPKTGARTVYEPSRVPFDSAGIQVEQVWYRSRDGARVPMFLVHRRGLPAGRPVPTMLTGYGGFDLDMTPRFSAEAALWVRRGGVWAEANLRGDGELGEAWHEGGMLANKQHVFDDFIAAARWLEARGYTTPSMLAIHGESNGGLLMGAALTQAPELFRAVLCGFPDLDMDRFYTFTDRNNMPAIHEYGDAADPVQFGWIEAFSPYEHVVDGTHYPAVFVFSGGHDTRVPPRQGRSFAAELQHATSSGLPVIYRLRAREGHAAGRGRPFAVSIEDQAMEQAFAMAEVGLGIVAH